LGGGQEIVATSNRLQRPIHVYKLVHDGIRRNFEFKILSQFGSPAYDSNSPLYILCADGRFPYVIPGLHKKVGDHFLSLFPISNDDELIEYEYLLNAYK